MLCEMFPDYQILSVKKKLVQIHKFIVSLNATYYTYTHTHHAKSAHYF